MAVLQRNVPVESATPTLLVERLPVGAHRIQLVVIDAAGTESAPAIANVNVVLPPDFPIATPGPPVRPPIIALGAATPTGSGEPLQPPPATPPVQSAGLGTEEKPAGRNAATGKPSGRSAADKRRGTGPVKGPKPRASKKPRKASGEDPS